MRNRRGLFANEKQQSSFFRILAEEMRKEGYSDEEIRKLRKLYSTDKGKKLFWKEAGLPREPSEEVVEKFGKSAQDNPYVLDLKDFFRQMVQRQNDLEKRVFDVNTRVSRMEGRFIVITALAVALTATIVGAIFRFLL